MDTLLNVLEMESCARHKLSMTMTLNWPFGPNTMAVVSASYRITDIANAANTFATVHS